MGVGIISATLIIEQLILMVHLGWSNKERERAQRVYVDLQINYLTPPAACANDDLTDTDCYYQLSLALQEVCDTKSYRLLESLAHDLFYKAKATLNAKTSLRLSLTKHPPLDNVQRVQFVMADE